MNHRQISDLGRAKLMLVGLEATPTLNALSVAFHAACFVLEDPEVNEDSEEENLTSSLLGAIRIEMRECKIAFENLNTPGCDWVEYHKQGLNVTEPESGFDFGIVLRLGNGQSRISLFQAKLDKAKSPIKLKPHRMSPPITEGGDEAPQFMRLREYAFKVLSRSGNQRRTSSVLAWVHYVVYGLGPCLSFSVDQMDSVRREYARRSKDEMDKANSIPLEDLQERKFRDLLVAGAESDKMSMRDGWLDTTDEAAKQAILELATVIPIFVGNHVDNGPQPPLVTQKELDARGITQRDVTSDDSNENKASELVVKSSEPTPESPLIPQAATSPPIPLPAREPTGRWVLKYGRRKWVKD